MEKSSGISKEDPGMDLSFNIKTDPFQHGEGKFAPIPDKDIEKAHEVLSKSDGSTASYYELPEGACELQDIISAKNMNSQIGEIFRACMRYGEVEHSPMSRDIKKIIFYAREELKRIERYEK